MDNEKLESEFKLSFKIFLLLFNFFSSILAISDPNEIFIPFLYF